MKTVLEVIRSGSDWLAGRGIESPRLNLELLLARALEIDRMQLYLRFEQPLDEDRLGLLREQMKRRAEGVPLQHLLGSVDFLGHEFACDARALIPRPETEVLVQRCLALDLPDKARVLDLATGSGVIGLTLAAERPGWQVTATDLSAEALSLARENAASLDLADRITWHVGDLWQPLDGGERFDLIVSNPPYIRQGELAELAPEVRHDPTLALDGGPDGLDLVRRIADGLSHFLAPGGWTALEVGHDQGEAARGLLARAGLVDTGVWSDWEEIARFPHGRLPG